MPIRNCLSIRYIYNLLVVSIYSYTILYDAIKLRYDIRYIRCGTIRYDMRYIQIVRYGTVKCTHALAQAHAGRRACARFMCDERVAVM
jgi:hypothetical protein